MQADREAGNVLKGSQDGKSQSSATAWSVQALACARIPLAFETWYFYDIRYIYLNKHAIKHIVIEQYWG